jgi:hypothetical protein
MHTKSQNIPNIQKEKTTHRILRKNVRQETNNLLQKNILLYNPQRDMALSTSTKESQKWWNKKFA